MYNLFLCSYKRKISVNVWRDLGGSLAGPSAILLLLYVMVNSGLSRTREAKRHICNGWVQSKRIVTEVRGVPCLVYSMVVQ